MAKGDTRRFSFASLSSFPATMLHVLAYLALALSVIFIIIGLGSEGWAVFSEGTFWTVINSFWLAALLLFRFADHS